MYFYQRHKQFFAQVAGGLEKIAAELDLTIPVAIRLNMDTGTYPQWSRFGFNIESGQAIDAVRRIESEQKTAGGIIIPDTAKEKPQEAEVVSVGDGKMDDDGKRLPMSVKKGDRVLFSKYAGTEIKVDGEERMILREDEILAIVE